MSDFEHGSYWAMALASTLSLVVIALRALASTCGG